MLGDVDDVMLEELVDVEERKKNPPWLTWKMEYHVSALSRKWILAGFSVPRAEGHVWGG